MAGYGSGGLCRGGRMDAAVPGLYRRDRGVRLFPGRAGPGGYQAQTLPEQWKLVRGGGYPQNRNELLGAFQFYFSDALAQRMVDEMLSGPDAPFLFYEGALYFRDDVPCGEKIDGMYTDWSWSSFTITDRVEKGFEGIEFTLSDNAAMNGDSAGKTWTFRLVLDEGYSVRFYCWFNLE